jgi:hypothetical protein
VSAPTYIPLAAAADSLGLAYRTVRRLAAEGVLDLKTVDDHGDGRVRLLVSLRSVNTYARRRKRKGKR